MKYFRFLLLLICCTLPSIVLARGKTPLTEGERMVSICIIISFPILIWAWFVYYRYQRTKDKRKFLRSSFMQAIFYPVIMTFLVLIFVNLISPSQVVKNEIKKKISHEDLLIKEQGLRKKVEENFTNPDLTFEYIRFHYQNAKEAENDYEIVNFYHDKIQADDPIYRDVAFIGLAYCDFQLKKYDEALAELNNIYDTKFPYQNYIKGCIYLEKLDTLKAIASLKSELAIRKNSEGAAIVLAEVYKAQLAYKELYEMIEIYHVDKYLPRSFVRKIYIVNNDVAEYILIEFSIIYSYISITIFISALLITLVWIYYLYKVDMYEKEKISYILIIFLYGCLFSFFAFPLYDICKLYLNFDLNGQPLNDLLYSVFGIGAIEELVKIIPLFIILWFTKEINEPFDYILYACVSALGFAFVENLMYLNHESMYIIQGRTFHAAIGHMCDSAIFAYGMVLARYRYNNFNPLIAFLLSYLVACVSHGLYDFFLFHDSALLFNILFYFEISLFTVIVNNCLNNSAFFSYENKPHHHKLELILSVSLVGILLFQYTINAFQYGTESANGSFFSSFLHGGLIIPFFVYKLSRLDMIKGYWFGFYNSVDNIHEQDRGGRAFVGMFVGDSIKPNNWVGTKINFRPDVQNKRLKSFVPGSVDARIIDRWVLPHQKEGKIRNDPYWFLLELENELNFPEGSFSNVLLKFKLSSPDIHQLPDAVSFVYLIPKEYEGNTENLRVNNLIPKGMVLLNTIPENL
jgi:RsiW-degrading membrane proteinase PrsW (M82 family)